MKPDRVPAILSKFIDGIAKASAGAQAMVHHHSDPRFITIYQKLEAVRSGAIKTAIKATGVTVQHVKH